MKLTPEQIEQNAAAYIAAMNGKPVQLLLDGVWKPSTNHVNTWHMESYCRRPAPEPKPPKLEPWDMKTCPPMPFEVVSKSGDLRTTLNTATHQIAYLGYPGSIYWANLLRDFTLPDGSPCGIVKEAK